MPPDEGEHSHKLTRTLLCHARVACKRKCIVIIVLSKCNLIAHVLIKG